MKLTKTTLTAILLLAVTGTLLTGCGGNQSADISPAGSSALSGSSMDVISGEAFPITEESTYNDIKGMACMQPFMKYIIGKTAENDPGMETPFGEKSFPEALHIAYDANISVPALNELIELADAGKLQSIDYYTENEISADPTLAETGLLYIPAEEPNGTFVMLISGGAFLTIGNEMESIPIAMKLREQGISSFVVQYRVAMPGALPFAVEDTHRATKYVLDHLDDFGLTDNYAIFGGSAGGYLATSFGSDNHGYQTAGITAPDFIMTCYPLVNLDPEDPTVSDLLGIMFQDPTPEMISEYNVIEHMSTDCPMFYIEATKDDQALAFETNAKALYDKLSAQGVNVTLKAVEHGTHGLGIATGYEAEGWLDEALALWQK